MGNFSKAEGPSDFMCEYIGSKAAITSVLSVPFP